MSGPSGKSVKSFQRIIGQKRMTSLSVFTQNGNSLPGEKQTTFLKRMRVEWSSLGEEARRGFQRKALLQKQQLPDTEKEKAAYLRRVCSELHKLTEFMKQLGWTFYFKISTGESTIESPTVPAAISDPIPPVPPVPPIPPNNKYDERRNLRRRVQELFNGLYCKATGRSENFPYKRHQRTPELAVTGMPHGVPFREPFTYGLPALQAILTDSSRIKMVPLHPSTSEPTSVSASANVREVPLWEEFTAVVSSLPEVALSPHDSGDITVDAAEEVLLKQEHSFVEAFLKQEHDGDVPLKQEHRIAEELRLKQEQSIAEGVLLKSEHVKAEEIPLNAGTCCKRPRVGDQHYGPYEVKKMEISPPGPKVIAAPPPQESTDVPVNVEVKNMEISPPAPKVIAAPPPQESTDVPVNVAEKVPLNTGTCCKRPKVGDQHCEPSEVKNMEISPPAPKVIAAPPPQESTDVPVNVEKGHPLSTNVQPSGGLDANAIPESQHLQQGPAEKSAMKRAGKKSQWTAEEVATMHQHFKEELEGRRLVEIRKIKEFVSEKKFTRTAFAVQNFLLRRRKREQD